MTIKETKEIILDLEYQKQIVEKEIESAKELLNNLSLNLQVQKEVLSNTYAIWAQCVCPERNRFLTRQINPAYTREQCKTTNARLRHKTQQNIYIESCKKLNRINYSLNHYNCYLDNMMWICSRKIELSKKASWICTEEQAIIIQTQYYSKAKRRKEISEMSTIAECAKLFFCFREQQGERFIRNLFKSGVLGIEPVLEEI